MDIFSHCQMFKLDRKYFTIPPHHPLPLWSIAVSPEIHFFKLILPIHSCPLAPASSEFSFHFQFKFDSVQLENFFYTNKILHVFCHLSFWLLRTISTIPFLEFVIRTFSLKWKSIFRGLNRARPLFWAGGRHVVQCEPVLAGQAAQVDPWNGPDVAWQADCTLQWSLWTIWTLSWNRISYSQLTVWIDLQILGWQ